MLTAGAGIVTVLNVTSVKADPVPVGELNVAEDLFNAAFNVASISVLRLLV